MIQRKLALASAVAATIVAGAVHAQAQTRGSGDDAVARQSAPIVTDTPPSSTTSSSHEVRTMARTASRVSNLIGTTVTDSHGEKLGEIDDLVVTPQGRLEAVLSVGGLFGVGDRLIAVPMDELMIERRNDDEMQVRIDATARQLLDRHPEFRYEPQADVR